ncbi:hypothetical protein ACSBR2_034571 [Camellia fascicularis]
MDTRSSALANNKFGGHDTVANHEYENLNSFVEPFFHADMYRQAYLFSIGPVPTVEKPMRSIDNAMILSPLSKRPAGRPKKNIIAST